MRADGLARGSVSVVRVLSGARVRALIRGDGLRFDVARCGYLDAARVPAWVRPPCDGRSMLAPARRAFSPLPV